MSSNNNKKKIFFYTGSLKGGGAERVLVEILKTIDRNKYKLLLGLHKLQGEYHDEIPKDVNIVNLSYLNGSRNFFKRITSLGNVIRQKNADLVVSFLTGSNCDLMRSSIFLRSSFKVILTEHTNPAIYTKKRFKSLKDFMRLTEIKALYSYSDKIITVSDGIRKEFVNNWKMNNDLFDVIHNPVNLKDINSESLQNIHLPWTNLDGYKVIVAVGRLVPQKAYHNMIKVIRKVRSKMPVKLIILGQGPLKDDIVKQIKRLNLSDDIYMPGFVSNPWAFMRKADLYLSTSRLEGFHMTIVEAMACGLPPIATDCDYGPSEIITSEVNGILVPVDNVKNISIEVLRLLNNDKLRKKISKNALMRARDFNLSSVTNQYECVFERVLNK